MAGRFVPRHRLLTHFWVASRQDLYDTATWDGYFERFCGRGFANTPLLVLASIVARSTWVGDWLATLAHFGADLGARATAWDLGPLVGLMGPITVIVAPGAYALWWSTRPSRPLLYAGALSISLFIAPYAGRYDALVLFASLAIAIAALHAAAPSARAAALARVVIVASPLRWFLHLLVLVDATEAVGSLVPLATFATTLICDRYARAGARAADGT